LVSFNQIKDFPTILQNYFSIDPISWVSSYIVAFFDYEGYWQLELMQYLFLVEGYGKIMLKNCKCPENKKITETKSKKDDSEMIDLFLENNPQIPEKIKKILNDSKYRVNQFEKRVECLFEDFTSDEVLKKILKLNENYHMPSIQKESTFIKVLQDYRNFYAHHDIDQLENIDPKHAYPFKCLLRLLLVFRLYSHMGLDIKTIFKGYSPSWLKNMNLVCTRFVEGDFYVCLNPTEIAKHTEAYPFVLVDEESYNEIKERHEKRKKLYVVCESHQNGRYTYNKIYSQEAQEAKVGDDSLCEYMGATHSKTFTKPRNSIGYIECKGEGKESLPLYNFLLYS
jgi:hypothetical protein